MSCMRHLILKNWETEVFISEKLLQSISHTHSLATLWGLTLPWLCLTSEQYREMGHKRHCNHTLLTTMAITSLNDQPFGPIGKTYLSAIFHLANGCSCQCRAAQIAAAMKKKIWTKAWLARAALEIFQIMEYFVRDNGIMRANTAWQGRINNHCKT